MGFSKHKICDDEEFKWIDNGLSATLSPEDDIFEYYETGSFTPTRTSIIQEEYVLANPSEDSNQVSAPTSIPQPIRIRQVIQDEYVEDNYTLARPSDDGNDAVRTVQHKDGQQFTQTQVNKKYKMAKQKKMMLIIDVLIVISVAGGVISYIALGKQGNELIY